MSEREKKIIETITTAINSGMSEFDKGYLLGMGEAMASKKQQEETEVETDKDKEKTAQRNRQKGETANETDFKIPGKQI